MSVPAAAPRVVANRGGDDVPFVRFDEAGRILSHGHMHRTHVEAEIEAGGSIAIHDHKNPSTKKHRFDRATGKIVDKAPAAKIDLQKLLAGIDRDLCRSHEYFLTDALDHISQAEQDAWRAYRKALRAARELSEAAAMLAALPKRDPKGIDFYAVLRG
jgi:hypothetical protein